MKTIGIGVILALFFTMGGIQDTSAQSQNENQITIVESLDDIKNSSSAREMSFKYTGSLNFAGIEKIKETAIEEFKTLVASKGFTHLYIDQEATKKSPFEMKKRDYTIIVVGTAFTK